MSRVKGSVRLLPRPSRAGHELGYGPPIRSVLGPLPFSVGADLHRRRRESVGVRGCKLSVPASDRRGAMGPSPTAAVSRVTFSALLLLLAVAASAAANTYTPTRFDDPPPGTCEPDDCSLREAITKANNHDGADKVVLAKGRYQMELPDDGTDDNENGDFDVIGEAAIRGAGPRDTVVDGNGLDTVFQFLTFSPHALSGVAVREGNASSGGGGVFVGPSALTLSDVVIKASDAAGSGGGLRSFSPELRLRRVTIRNNDAGGAGGGIHLGVSVADSSVSIRSSTISDNDAEDGGGIAADETDGISTQNQLTVRALNSTVNGNRAERDGGGIRSSAGATVTLDNVTIAENVANSDNVGIGVGGGLDELAASFSVGDTVLFGNTVGQGGSNEQCDGSFASLGGNVVQTSPGCAALGGMGDQLVADALIGTLAANGGPTKTVALLGGSPALGFAVTCPKRDQRGEKRPPNCDSSAFERKKSDP